MPKKTQTGPSAQITLDEFLPSGDLESKASDEPLQGGSETGGPDDAAMTTKPNRAAPMSVRTKPTRSLSIRDTKGPAQTSKAKPGGSGPSRRASGPRTTSKKAKDILLRVPDNIMEKVKEAVNARSVKTTRHHWILEALYCQACHELGGGKRKKS